MASFALPNFNLTAGVWHSPGRAPALYGPPDLVTPCNLANGRVSHVLQEVRRTDVRQVLGASASALFPKQTDLRDFSVTSDVDVVEIPLHSGRYYWVAFVDDIAKGFVNEHRWAILPKVHSDGFYDYRWPSIIP